jgi:hypothetical protein
MAKFSIWTAIEYDLAIVCASIPTLKPFFNKVIPGLLSSRLATIISRRIPGFRTSRFSTLQETVKTSAATDGSIHMKPIVGKEVKTERSWNPMIARDKTEVTKTVVFYSGKEGASDEYIMGEEHGIVRTTKVDVESKRGGW